jgi:hypothetical protein
MSALSPRAPEIMALTRNGAQPCIHGPRVACAGLSAPEPIRMPWPPRAAPLPHRCVRHRDPACKQPFCAIALAAAETALEPYRMADDLDRDAVVRMAVDGWCVQAPSMAHQASARPAAQQVDNTCGRQSQTSDVHRRATRACVTGVSLRQWRYRGNRIDAGSRRD